MDCVAPQVTHIVALVIVAYGAHDGAGIDLAVVVVGVVRDGAVPAVVVLALAEAAAACFPRALDALLGALQLRCEAHLLTAASGWEQRRVGA